MRAVEGCVKKRIIIVDKRRIGLIIVLVQYAFGIVRWVRFGIGAEEIEQLGRRI